MTIFAIGIILPSTPRASKSLLFAKNKKDSLLVYSPSPRIILIGGSGLSFGLNSQILKDSLQINPINTAIHGAIGLSFMITTVLDFIKPGDIVVVVPEYQFFFGRNSYGGEELLRTVMEVSPKSIKKLSSKQWFNIVRFFPKYSFSKFKLLDYIDGRIDSLYSVYSFNDFGDVCAHWNRVSQGCMHYNPIDEKFNDDIVKELLQFQKKINDRKASLYITFPGLQASSFNVFNHQIKKIEMELIRNEFSILGTPERYNIPDSLIFDAPYHLSKAGVDLRTLRLLEDLKKIGIN